MTAEPLLLCYTPTNEAILASDQQINVKDIKEDWYNSSIHYLLVSHLPKVPFLGEETVPVKKQDHINSPQKTSEL